MQEYSFWSDMLNQFKKIECPNCGNFMTARRVAPHNQILYLCSSCVLAVDIEYDKQIEKPQKIGNIRRTKK